MKFPFMRWFREPSSLAVSILGIVALGVCLYALLSGIQ